VAKLG